MIFLFLCFLNPSEPSCPGSTCDPGGKGALCENGKSSYTKRCNSAGLRYPPETILPQLNTAQKGKDFPAPYYGEGVDGISVQEEAAAGILA